MWPNKPATMGGNTSSLNTVNSVRDFDPRQHVALGYPFRLHSQRRRRTQTFKFRKDVEEFQYVPLPFPFNKKSNPVKDDVCAGFHRWDPFYKCLHNAADFAKERSTNKVVEVKYSDGQPSIFHTFPVDSKENSCLDVVFQFPVCASERIIACGCHTKPPLATGDTRLILQLLPLRGKAQKKKWEEIFARVELNGELIESNDLSKVRYRKYIFLFIHI